MRHRSLPRITIPVACTADWSAMRPLEADGRARLCGACDTPVYDSRSMTRAELARLIEKHEGSLPCLRLLQRPDGTIVTGNCFTPVLRAGRFLWLKATMAAVAFWSTLFAFWSWTRRPVPSIIETPVRVEKDARMLPFLLKGLPAIERIRGEENARRNREAIKAAAAQSATLTLGRPKAHVSKHGHHRATVGKPADDPLSGLLDL